MLYMVIEHFRDGAAPKIYERFREKGRMLPDGLVYIDSWLEKEGTRCFQLMETDDRALLDECISHWQDIVEFEVFPVITSAEAAGRVNKFG